MATTLTKMLMFLVNSHNRRDFESLRSNEHEFWKVQNQHPNDVYGVLLEYSLRMPSESLFLASVPKSHGPSSSPTIVSRARALCVRFRFPQERIDRLQKEGVPEDEEMSDQQQRQATRSGCGRMRSTGSGRRHGFGAELVLRSEDAVGFLRQWQWEVFFLGG